MNEEKYLAALRTYWKQSRAFPMRQSKHLSFSDVRGLAPTANIGDVLLGSDRNHRHQVE